MAERETDEVYRRQMALGIGVQADFDEALAEMAATPRKLTPQPDKGVPFAEALDEVMREHHGALAALDDDPEHRRQMAAARRVMRQHRDVFAALAESERRDREAEVGHANVRRGLAG